MWGPLACFVYRSLLCEATQNKGYMIFFRPGILSESIFTREMVEVKTQEAANAFDLFTLLDNLAHHEFEGLSVVVVLKTMSFPTSREEASRCVREAWRTSNPKIQGNSSQPRR